MIPVCAPEIHAAMKRSPMWSLLRYVGRMHIEADGDLPAETLELRNCGCNSTLCKTVAPAWEQALRDDELRRIRLRAAKLPARRLTALNPVTAPTAPTGGKP